MVIRIYLTYKLLNHYSVWTNERSQRVGKLQGVNTNSIFATKVMFQNSPIKTLIILSVIFLIIFSFLLRAFEYFDKNQKNSPFNFVWNSIWLNFITMTTVGYGDYYPETNFGKIFCVFSCLFGNFLLSMLVAVLSLHVYFDSEELKVFNKLMEKELIYEYLPNEIKDLFITISDIFKFKNEYENLIRTDKNVNRNNNIMLSEERSNNNIKINFASTIKERNDVNVSGQNSDNIYNENEKRNIIRKALIYQKMLLKFKLKFLNDKKKLVISNIEDNTEIFLDKFESHLDLDFSECLNKAQNLCQFQKNLIHIVEDYTELADKIIESRDLANRITNIANLMRIISTCGNLQNITEIEGGRLFTKKELIEYQNYFLSKMESKKLK